MTDQERLDDFAKAALIGILANSHTDAEKDAIIADLAYRHAEAMMLERAQRPITNGPKLLAKALAQSYSPPQNKGS